MRLLITLLLLMTCPFFSLLVPGRVDAPPDVPPTTMPTETPPSASAVSPRLEIDADRLTLQVGDTVTITGVPVNIGLPYYTLSLSSGASFTVTYMNEVRTNAPDSLFEMVEARGEMNRVTITLRALSPGSAEATLSATGEVRVADQAFSWGGGNSAPLTLTVED